MSIREPLTEDRATPVDQGRVGTVLELLAMVLAAAAGFAAPTDWNFTLGLAITAVALFAIGFFALTGSEA